MTLPTSLEAFLQPISASQPAGQPLRFAPQYDAIRETMRFEDPNLPLGVWLTDIKQADWPKAVKLCTEALTTQSKDLQIAAWLIEAWMRVYNMPGLTKGLELMSALTQTFWTDAYPQLGVDGDLDMRASPFIWMNDKLSKRLTWMRVTLPTQTGAQSYSFYDWITVSRLKDLYPTSDRSVGSKPLEQVGGNKKPDLLDFNTNVQQTPSSFYQDMQEEIVAALHICQNLDQFVNEKFKGNGPGFFRIKNFLKDLQRFVVQTLYDRGFKEDTALITTPPQELANPAKEGIESPLPTPPDDTLVKGVPMTPTSPFSSSAPPTSQTADMLLEGRDSAYQQIEQAVAYLAKIEPHSPVPYLIRRALSWRTKNFVDVMNEMVHDPGSLADLNRLLGLKGESTGSHS